MDQLRSLVEAADKEKVELLNQLEEERRYELSFRRVTASHRTPFFGFIVIFCVLSKRKVEDLQFRVEEACITKGDLEVNLQRITLPPRVTVQHVSA